MTFRNAKLKQLPKTTDKAFLESVRQMLETYQGNTGSPYGFDRVVRVSDIVNLDPATFLSNMQRRSFTSRITRITGNIIRLGRIESNDSTTYFDLDNNKFVMNSKVNYSSAMPGLFMGKDDDGIYKFNMGHATNGEVKFNGTNVYLNKWVITENGIGNSADEDNSTIVLDGTNKKIRVGPSTGYIDIDGDNRMIQSSDYSSGAMGSGFHLSAGLLETGNIACRGIFRTSVFQKASISAVGGSMAILTGADVLAADMSAEEHTTFLI